jgi:hypothetical protein
MFSDFIIDVDDIPTFMDHPSCNISTEFFPSEPRREVVEIITSSSPLTCSHNVDMLEAHTQVKSVRASSGSCLP